MSDIASLGFTRLLSSGRAATAADPAGAALLGRLQRRHGGAVSVMPGAGITRDNLRAVLEATGATEFHASARSRVQSRMKFKNDGGGCSMGGAGADEYAAMVTDEDKVRDMVNIFNQVQKEREGGKTK